MAIKYDLGNDKIQVQQMQQDIHCAGCRVLRYDTFNTDALPSLRQHKDYAVIGIP